MANLEARIIEALGEFSSWGITAQEILHEMIDHAIVRGEDVSLPASGRGLIKTLHRLLADGKITREVEAGLVRWRLAKRSH